MRFAIVDNKRIEAAPKAQALCPGCLQPVIAKCGLQRVNHWAHLNNKNCDTWWEPETLWHRSWKNNYSTECMEIVLFDEITKEKHIADVRTVDGLVLEFQHSSINSTERIAREKFYNSMLWIVDGTRLKRDYSRFLKGRTDLEKTNNPAIFHVHFPDECFPSSWIASAVPVIFDFKGNETIRDPNDLRNHLYCLLPKTEWRPAMLITLSREKFIESTINGKWLSNFVIRFDKLNQGQQLLQGQFIQNSVIRRSPQYYLHKGRWVRRRRF
ncbi:MAG: competence protein [Chitinophagaceae bacterium]|nr:competence protein [Chitinophagaceae bacterium]